MMNNLERHDALMVYVHIPKTAGSSVNQILREWDDNGRSHFHHEINSDSESLKGALGAATWISAHCDQPKMSEKFSSLTSRSLKFYTIVRSPFAQVASHYNWLIEIFHRGESFYSGHPERIKEISETIRNNDNSDPVKIIGVLRKFSRLFLNQQSRYVLGPNFKGGSADDIFRQLMRYEYIATEDKLSALVKAMTGRDVKDIPVENRSDYHFDKGVFRDYRILDFLGSQNHLDSALYEVIKSIE